MSPVTSGTSLGRTQAKPVDRLSSTTTVLAGIEQGQHHVAADIARPARHQNRHPPLLLAREHPATHHDA